MKQVATGVNGLDDILDGGFLRPSVVLIGGAAGTGKTTMAMQSIFNAARKEETCMYVTALSEPIATINNFMSKFSFYNVSLLGKGNVKYVPLDIEVIHKGSKAIINEMERNIDIIKPDRIVIDPVNVLTIGLDDEALRQFYYDFFTGMKAWNSFVLLTGEFISDSLIKSSLSYLSDGVIYLSNEPYYGRNIRYLNVLKMRGRDFSGGIFSCKITTDGFTVFPRRTYEIRTSIQKESISTGIKGLDQMTSGGFKRGSAVLLSGPSGTGKTAVGIQFIVSCLSKNEPGIIVSFEEDAVQIRDNAMMFGWDLKEFEKKNLLKIINPLEFDASELALLIYDQVEKTKAKCMMMDGINRLHRMMPPHIQFLEYMDGFINSMKRMNVTAIYANETQNLTGSTKVTGMGISPMMDTIILLRYVEIKSEMRKAISLLKMRGSDHDKDIRELAVSKKGVEIKLPFSEYSGLLSGSPVKTPSDAFVEAFRR